MLTGHEKPITEYSNPFMMLCRKYSLPERLVYLMADMAHPGKVVCSTVPTAIDCARRVIITLRQSDNHALDDFDRCMEQLYKAHGLNYVDLLNGGDEEHTMKV